MLNAISTDLLVGEDSAGDPPDPIPNSEVKPCYADGTAGATLWESRYRRPPFRPPVHVVDWGFFYSHLDLALLYFGVSMKVRKFRISLGFLVVDRWRFMICMGPKLCEV